MTDRSFLDPVLVPVAREGWPFIAIAAGLAVLLYFVAEPLGLLGVAATLFCTYFFRNPDRVTPTRRGLVVAPADGVVQMIVDAPPPAELDLGSDPVARVSIFLSVLDVHINRVPVDGRVTKLAYVPGSFVNAAMDKASEDNERQLIGLETHDGRKLAVVQIAGLIARRIICYLRDGQSVQAGERFGLIRFGSRTDIFLPAGVQPQVVVGQRCVGGETVIADLDSGEGARRGEVR